MAPGLYQVFILVARLVVIASLLPGSVFPAAAQDRALPGAAVDLDVTFINRAPLYKAYCVAYRHDAPNTPGRPYLCPGTENDRRWPEPGEVVTFTAHIINKGTVASPAFDYAWHMDGAEVARGRLPALDPAAEATATYRWPWGHGLSPDGQRALGQHTVRFTVDPDNAIAESYESNNSLEDRTEAMSFSLYITPEMYAAYNTPVDPQYPHSAEDWLQKQIAAMNAAFAHSIYPVTPQGIALRVRINTIGIAPTDPVPDGAHDGGWYLQEDVRHEGGYYDPATDIDWGLVHELSHQVSIIDMYAMGVYAANVFVQKQDGNPANVGFFWHSPGIMGGGETAPHYDPHLYDSASAGGASTFAGYRNGFYGSYLFDIPLDNYLRILDSAGNPAPGVAVALYQRTGPWDATGHMGVDNTPEITGVTDASGIFHLPNRSANGGVAAPNGHIMHDNPFGVVDVIGNQGLLLVKLARAGHEEFHWLNITQFNEAYWLGDTISHTFTISSHVPPPAAPAPPALTAVRGQGTWVSLDWQPSPSAGVVGYRVYRAAAPQYRYEAAGDLLTGTHFEEYSSGFGDGEHRIYAVTAVDGAGRESGFGELVYAPGIDSPVAVAAAPDGARLVLNAGNLYPLLRQQPDGRYTHRVVNVHYDLWNAHSLAFDPAGRLLISGFGESAFGRKAVRVYDAGLQPVMFFGDSGSGPGQFIAPAGVAWWGPPFAWGGPYGDDGHALLLLHFDGSYAGARGEARTPNGTPFAAGRHGQGVLIAGADTLTYPVAGNLDGSAGAIEFWVQPQWNHNDGQMHCFFETADPTGRGIEICKDGNGYLHFILKTLSGQDGAGCWLPEWQAGEWHHLAFTWSAEEAAVYMDGRPCGQRDGVPPPVGLDGIFYVGSSSRGDWQADAVFDELRISDLPRLGNSDSSGRFLVADGGANRIQAFDALGRLVAGFGSAGSGPGQFDNPQGLAIHSSGRVVVADSGNDRLQLLSFDGASFRYLRSLTAGFAGPTGVAADGRGHVAVADTGHGRVVVFDPQGRFLAEYAAANDGYTGPFNAPRGVAIAADGDLVVADTGNHRVVTVRGALLGWRTIWLPLLIRR